MATYIVQIKTFLNVEVAQRIIMLVLNYIGTVLDKLECSISRKLRMYQVPEQANIYSVMVGAPKVYFE